MKNKGISIYSYWHAHKFSYISHFSVSSYDTILQFFYTNNPKTQKKNHRKIKNFRTRFTSKFRLLAHASNYVNGCVLGVTRGPRETSEVCQRPFGRWSERSQAQASRRCPSHIWVTGFRVNGFSKFTSGHSEYPAGRRLLLRPPLAKHE